MRCPKSPGKAHGIADGWDGGSAPGSLQPNAHARDPVVSPNPRGDTEVLKVLVC